MLTRLFQHTNDRLQPILHLLTYVCNPACGLLSHMSTVRTVLNALEKIAPARFAFGFDSVGLQVGDPDAPVSCVVVSLDRSLGALEFARKRGAEVVLAHHPLFFDPIPRLTTQNHQMRTALEFARSGVACIAAHTNWDSALGGVNDELASRLGLVDVEIFGSAARVPMRKLVVTVPHGASEGVARAAGDAGAGIIGNYSSCAFLNDGVGQFLPGEGARPTIGHVGTFERVNETRIEMTCHAERVAQVIAAIRRAHPYEEPALDVYVLEEAHEQPAGRMGLLSEPMSFDAFVQFVDDRLGTRSWAWGDVEGRIQRVAVVGGAADGEWNAAKHAGADVFVTGEVKQHIALEASESGLSILASGHYATEHPGVEALANRLRAVEPNIDWLVFAPTPGLHGRPF